MDFFLRAPNRETMHYAMRVTYEALTGTALAEDAPTPLQGLSQTGTSWVVDDIGAFYEKVGEQEDESGRMLPIMQPREGYHAILRWNGGDDIPDPGPLEIVWRSDAVDEEGNPVPPPSWWSRVLA